MDKQTLSNYGWIVIAVLVLSVMIALSTPFGEYIKEATEHTTEGLFATEEKSLNTIGISLNNPLQNDNNVVLSIEELEQKYEFTYYETLNDAMSTINNGIAIANIVEKEDAEVGIYIDENGRINVVLMKNITLNERLHISTDMCLNLGGHTLDITVDSTRMGIYINTNQSGNFVTIDGRLDGSTINITTNVAKTAGIMVWNGEKAEFLGFKLNGVSNVGDVAFWEIYVQPNGELKMNNCTIKGTSDKDILYALRTDAKTTIKNTKIELVANWKSYGILANNDLTISDSQIDINTNDDILDDQNYAIGLYVASNSKINNTNISIIGNGTYSNRGLEIRKAANVKIDDSNIKTNIKNGYAYGIISEITEGNGMVKISNCNLKAYSEVKLTENGSMQYYSYAIDNYDGKYDIKDSYLYGNRYGMSTHDNLNMKNSTVESLFYAFSFFSKDVNANIQNSIIQKCYNETSIFGYENVNHIKAERFISIGGGSGDDYGNNKVILNNTKIYGDNEYLIGFRNDGNKVGDILYMSNCEMTQDAKINVNGTLHQVYLGKGNNFSKEIVNYPEYVTETQNVYTEF